MLKYLILVCTIIVFGSCRVMGQEFQVMYFNEEFKLINKSTQRESSIPQEWLYLEDETDLEFMYFYDSSYYPVIKYQIDRNHVGLIAIPYGIAGKYAIGVNFHLIYEIGSGKVNSASALKSQQSGRWSGPCRGAIDFHYLMSRKISGGARCLGIIKEEINCTWVDDIPSRQVFSQSKPMWFVWQGSAWAEIQADKVDAGKIKFLENLYPGPIDVTGNGVWKSYNPLYWNHKENPKFWPNNRMEKCLKEAERKGDTDMVNKLSSLKN